MNIITINTSNGPLTIADDGITIRGIRIDTIEVVPGPHNLEPADVAAGYTDLVSYEGAEAGLVGSALVRAEDMAAVRRCIPQEGAAS